MQRKITADSKNEILERITKYLDISNACHCQIYMQDKHIAKCYDCFMNCWFDSSKLKLRQNKKKN